jgi:hypothetical protein
VRVFLDANVHFLASNAGSNIARLMEWLSQRGAAVSSQLAAHHEPASSLARAMVLTAAVLAQALSPAWIAAHDLTAERVIPAYVRVEPGHVRLLVRVPLDVLGDIGFVARRREIQVQSSDPAVARALASVDAWFVLAERGTRLSSSGARARLTLPSDRSFDSYDSALAHVEQALALSEAVYLDQGFLDLSLTFRTDAPAPDLSMRLYSSALFPSAVKAAVQYLPIGGAGRSLVATSRAGGIALDPSVADAAWWFLRSGLHHVSTSARYLLLLLCLMASLRTIDRAWPVVVMLSVGRSAAVIGTAFSLASLGRWVVPPVEAAATASLAAVTLAGLVGLELHRRLGVAAFLGLLHGLIFSFALRDELPVADSHRLVAAVAFNVGLELGQLGVAGASIALSALATRGRQVALLAIAVTALVAHLVWHSAIDQGAALWTSGVGRAEEASALILARWIAGVAVAAAAANWIGRRWRRRRAAQADALSVS